MKNVFNIQMNRLSKHVREFPWADAEAYRVFLAQTYYYVAHSTRLLCASAARFSAEQEQLHRRFLQHTGEEKSHHLLALRDLEALGGKIENYPELSGTRLFYEPQYYKVEHQDPTALLGYILALEGLAVTSGRWIYELVIKEHGKKPASFLQVHVDEDPDHLTKAFEVVERLNAHQRALIETNLVQSATAYGVFLNDIANSAVGRTSTSIHDTAKRAA